MAGGLTPIRRVVTGVDARGRSKVVWDGPSPGTHPTELPGRGHTDFWVWRETPAPLAGEEDAGTLAGRVSRSDRRRASAGRALASERKRSRQDAADRAAASTGSARQDLGSRRRQ
jgi:hypothetical protein